MSSASGASPLDPHQGSAPGPRWGTSVLSPRFVPLRNKFLAMPLIVHTCICQLSWLDLSLYIHKEDTFNDRFAYIIPQSIQFILIKQKFNRNLHYVRGMH